VMREFRLSDRDLDEMTEIIAIEQYASPEDLSERHRAFGARTVYKYRRWREALDVCEALAEEEDRRRIEQERQRLAALRNGDSLEDLELPFRTYNSLMGAGYSTVGELARASASELRAIPNSGKWALDDVQTALAARGLKLRDAATEVDG